MVGASVATRPMIGDTMLRLDGGKIVKAAANTDGIMPPPIKPCSTRYTIIWSILVAVAASALAIVKPAADTENSTRVETIRASVPESGIMMTSAIR